MNKLLVLLALSVSVSAVNAAEVEVSPKKIDIFVENTTHYAFAKYDNKGEWVFFGKVPDERMSKVPHEYFIPVSERAKITSYGLN